MPAYRFAGLTLASDFPFPELPATTHARRPALRIAQGERRPADVRRRWRHRWRFPGGRVWMRVAREGRSTIVQFPRLGEFELRGRSITCHPRTGVPLRTLRHLLLDQLLPALLSSARRLVVHASAVEIDGRVAGFVGPSGAGKSTLAAALVRGGASALCDDALVIALAGTRAVAIPTYPGLRLWPASRPLIGPWPRVRRTRVAHYSRKQRWSGPSVLFAARPFPLTALYLITRGKRPTLREVAGRRSLMAVVKYSMLLEAGELDSMKNNFRMAAAVVDRVQVKRIVLPPGVRSLAAICRAIREDLRRT